MAAAHSLSTRLIIILTLCTGAILSLGLGLDYHLSRNEILSRVELQSRDTVSAAVTDLDNFLDGVADNAVFLSRILQQRSYSDDELRNLLHDIVAHNDDIVGSTIALNPDLIDAPLGFAPYYYREGDQLLTADLTFGDTRYWERSWYADAASSGKPVWVEPYFDAEGARVLMTTFSVPVFRPAPDGSSQLYAVVTADVGLAELQRYLRRLHLGQSGFGILLSRAGLVLGAPNTADLMQPVSVLTDDPNDRAQLLALFNGALAGETRTGEVACHNIPGDCLVRLSPMKSTGWPLGVVYARDEVLAPLHEYQAKTVSVGLLTLVLMALAVSWVARRITQPLRALARASGEIARGEMNVALPAASGQDEVATLVRSFNAMQGDLKRYIEDLEHATASRSRLAGELAAAREIQMSMLPGRGHALERDAGNTLWAQVEPAKTVGGDLYSYRTLADGRLCFVLGDVSDKGVPAALFMARAISQVQMYNQNFDSAAAVLSRLNNALERGNDNCMFLTLFCGAINLHTGELEFASAGHCAPVILRKDKAEELEQQTGPALGLAPNLSFPTNRIALHPGDRLVLRSDGAEEAFDAHDRQFGLPRLLDLLTRTANDSAAEAGRQVFAGLSDFQSGTAQSDDISLLILDWDNRERSRQFMPGPGLTSRAIQWLEQELAALPVSHDVQNNVLLAGEEAASNVEKYGGLSPAQSLRVRLLPRRGELLLSLTDPGPPFNPLTCAGAELGHSADSAQIGGLGVHLIRALPDWHNYRRSEDNNELTLAFRLPRNA